MQILLFVFFLGVVCVKANKLSSVLFPTSLSQIDLSHDQPPTFREKVMHKLSNPFARYPGSALLGVTGPQSTPMLQQPSRKHPRLNFFRNLPLFKGGTKKKMLILMSDTGGGHRASAEALGQALQEKYPGRVDVNIMDIWTDHGKFPFNKSVPVYRYLAKRPLLWRAFYSYGLFPPTKLFTELDSQRLCYKSFKLAIEAADPDFVVSVHPLCQLMPISIVKEMNRNRAPSKPRIPFVTVVTDLGSAHSCWFDSRADAVYVPSEEVRSIALRNHVPASRILMKGLPIRPAFWRPSLQPRNVIRRGLGIPQDSKTVLLMGGGDGVGGLGYIATEITNKLRSLEFKSNLIVVCGKNKKIQDELTQKLVVSPSAPVHTRNQATAIQCITGLSSISPTRIINRITGACGGAHGVHSLAGRARCTNSKNNVGVVVKGFVHNVDELMTASDLLVTKAGPGTIAEAMTRGLPMILSSYLPGQEYGNVPYVVKGGFGVYTGNNPRRIADKVSELLSDPVTLRCMSSKARALSRPDATRTIAADIACVLLNNKRC